MNSLFLFFYLKNWEWQTLLQGDMVDMLMKELSLKEKDALDLGYSLVQGRYGGLLLSEPEAYV